jgi:hypothetical protein
MNSKPIPDIPSLASLSDQFEGLLSFLRQKEEAWLSSKFNELSGLPDELESMLRALSASVSDMRLQLQSNGQPSIREWVRQSPEGERETGRLIDTLEDKIRQTRQVARVQQLLAQNLLAYVRGAAMLSESTQKPTYAGNSDAIMRARRLEIRG